MLGNPEVDEFGIRCKECRRKFKKLTHAHLYKIHGLTIDAYKERWGLCKNQPLEAFYIKSIRQKFNKKYQAYKQLDNKAYQFKKGRVGRQDKRRWQELYRLQKYNDRIKGKFLCVTPAEITCIFDLHYRLGYPKERVAIVMKLATNYIRDLLVRKDIYERWKSYYIRSGDKINLMLYKK